VCAKACPRRAIYKEKKYGAVLVSPEKCTGERKCWKACPYGAPQFEGDGSGLKMSKCDMCIERLEMGNKPICVLSCSLRALEFGLIEELREKYGDLIQLEEMPRNSITRPAAIFKPIDAKKQIIPWDWKRALELWQKRHPDGDETLPDIFAGISDVSQAPDDIIGRNKLVLKAKSSEELMFHTTDDE
jgi:anaerobic dimethyl sulfoxide reductase subunit B (iron-sulfur subunit)